jgi:hypothetical protein
VASTTPRSTARRAARSISAAGLEHAVHLAQRHVLVGDIAQAEGDCDAVEIVIRKRQAFGIGLDEAHITGDALIQQACATVLEHRGVDIRQHHFAIRADDTRQACSEIAGAAGEIEHATAFAHTGQLDGETFPQTMNA